VELSLDYHPSEIARKLELTWLAFWDDQDFRHPELRHRLGLELSFRAKQVNAGEDIRPFIDPILEEFDRSDERVPIIELWVLMEWNERYQRAQSLLEISTLLKDLAHESSILAEPIRERIEEIRHTMLTQPLPTDPSWIELLRFRWRNAAFRDEIRYFRSLLR